MLTAEIKIDRDDLRDGLEAHAREVGRELANRWFSEAQQILIERGDREDYEVFPVAQAALPPQWDESKEAWVAEWPHGATLLFEFGTLEHEIEGDPILSFVWPAETAPDWVREQFEPEGDGYRAFLTKVEVNGITTLRFLRDAQERMRQAATR